MVTSDDRQRMELSLHILSGLFTRFTQVIAHYPAMIETVSRGLLANLTILVYYQQTTLGMFADVVTIFAVISNEMASHLKKELELFYEKVVFQLLGSISVCKQVDQHWKERLLLQGLIDVFSRPHALETFFRNYDCSPFCLNLTSILYNIVGLLNACHTDLREDPVLLLVHLAGVLECAPKVQDIGAAGPVTPLQQHHAPHQPSRPPSPQLSSGSVGREDAVILRNLAVRSPEPPVHEGRCAIQQRG